MNNKRYLLAAALLIAAFFSNAQQREIGLTLSNFEDFGFTYKKQKSENQYTRFDVVNTTLAYVGDFTDSDAIIFGANFGVGFEKRVDLAEKVKFFHGWAPLAGFTLVGGDSSTGLIVLGIDYMLGFQIHFSDAFYTSIETRPGLTTNLVINDDSTVSTASLGFDSNAVGLSLVYRFVKQ